MKHFFCILNASLLNASISQVRGRKIRQTLRNTSLLPPVDVRLLCHPRSLLFQLGPCQEPQSPLSLLGSRCHPCFRCSRSRTGSHQFRSLKAWIQWESFRKESTGIYGHHLWTHLFISYIIQCFCPVKKRWLWFWIRLAWALSFIKNKNFKMLHLFMYKESKKPN